MLKINLKTVASGFRRPQLSVELSVAIFVFSTSVYAKNSRRK
jgi:hypothetical protein